MLGTGLVWAAQAASVGLAKGAELAMTRLAPAQQPVNVSPEMRQRLANAAGAAGKLGEATSKLAAGV